MSIIKCTMRINWGSTRGWSESFYLNDTTINEPNLKKWMEEWARVRAGALAKKCTILDVRVSDVAAPNVVRSFEMNLLGTFDPAPAAGGSDPAMLAILFNYNGTSGVRRSFLNRGIPDSSCLDGYLTVAAGNDPAFKAWLNYPLNWFSIRDVTNDAKKDVVNVSGDSRIVETAAAHGYAVGQMVIVKTRVEGGGEKVRATYQIESIVSPTQFRLKKWSYGNCIGGTVNGYGITWSPITTASIVRPALVRTRQTGLPFGLLRGRRSNRR